MLASHGIRTIIPLPAEQARHRPQQRRLRGTPTRIDAERHKDRHAVECGISILKHHRDSRPATTKLAVRHHATSRNRTLPATTFVTRLRSRDRAHAYVCVRTRPGNRSSGWRSRARTDIHLAAADASGASRRTPGDTFNEILLQYDEDNHDW